jgi:hypothetical protein
MIENKKGGKDIYIGYSVPTDYDNSIQIEAIRKQEELLNKFKRNVDILELVESLHKPKE